MNNNNMQTKTEQVNPTPENKKMRWESPEIIVLSSNDTNSGATAAGNDNTIVQGNS